MQPRALKSGKKRFEVSTARSTLIQNPSLRRVLHFSPWGSKTKVQRAYSIVEIKLEISRNKSGNRNWMVSQTIWLIVDTKVFVNDKIPEVFDDAPFDGGMQLFEIIWDSWSGLTDDLKISFDCVLGLGVSLIRIRGHPCRILQNSTDRNLNI